MPKRRFNLGHLGFMEYEGVKFFSENIHMAGRLKNKKSSALKAHNISVRELRPDKQKSRLERILKKNARIGLSMNFKIKEEENEG